MPSMEQAAATTAADAPNAEVGDLTPAQKAQATKASNAKDEAFEEAKAQHAADAQLREENPYEPVSREANPKFGGESFGYGGPPE